MKPAHYLGIVGILFVLAFSMSMANAQDLELEIPILYVNANHCANTQVIIENTGTEDVNHISLPEKLHIPNCCTLTTSKQIETLGIGEIDSIPMRVCASPSGLKGMHVHDVPISTYQGDTTARFTIHVTKDLSGVLQERIERVNSALKEFSDNGLFVNQLGAFIAAHNSISAANANILNGDFEEAEIFIATAEDLLEVLEEENKGISFTYIVFPALIIIIFLIGIALIYIYSNGTEHLDRPSLPSRINVRDKKSIIKSINALEKTFSKMEKGMKRRVDIIYFRKTQRLLDSAREYVEADNIEMAKRVLSNAEMSLKVLEHRLASLSLLEQIEDFSRSINY